MKVKSDDKLQYEAVAVEWLIQMNSKLKNVLKKNNVPKNIQEEICGEFSFDLAMLQDQGKIKTGSQAYRPVICFEDNEQQLVFASDDKFQLHEYVYGVVEELF